MLTQSSSYEFITSDHVAINAKLSPELLMKVLDKLDQQQLGVASLVCACWRDTCLIALKQLTLNLTTLNLKSQGTGASLLPYWLRSRAQHLQHLELWYFGDVTGQLPLGNATQLRSLRFNVAKLRGSVSDMLPSLKHSLTALAIGFASVDKQLLSSIAALTNLHSLSLQTVSWVTDAASTEWQLPASWSEAASSVFSNLLQLTSLVVTNCGLDDQFVQQITHLSNLQQLDLSENKLRDARVLQAIPNSVTYLSLGLNHEMLDCSNLLEQPCPQQLQHLSITGLSMSNAGQLSAVTQLTFLEASWLRTPDNAQLLAVLPHMQHLQHLDLNSTFNNSNRRAVIRDLNAALQLPQLTCLRFGGNGFAVQPWEGPQHQCPPAPVLFSSSNIPRLQVLLLNRSEEPLDNGPDTHLRREGFRVLVDKCPKLQRLDVRRSIHKGCSAEDLQPLQQLSCLTRLTLGGGIGEGHLIVDDNMLKLLATLTTLEYLLVAESREVTDLGLMSLTKLTRLTWLLVTLDGAAVSPPITQSTYHDGTNSRDVFIAKDEDPEQRSVSQQLSQRCTESLACMRERHKELERELKEAKEESTTLREMILTECKRTAAAKEEAAAAKEEAAATKEAAAAAMAEVAALKCLLTELRAANSSEPSL